LKVIVARTDGIGDLLSATALIRELRRAGHAVDVLASEYAALVLLNNPDVHKVIRVRKDGSRDELRKEIEAGSYDVSICVFPDPLVASVLRKAGVPRRIGTVRRWHSLLNFNRPVFISRKRSVKHESEYNLDLARGLIGDPEPVRPYMYLSPAERAAAETLQARLGLEPGFVVLHPGSKGSAWNPDPRSYARLCEAIRSTTGRHVYVSGAESDRPAVEALLAACPPARGLVKTDFRLGLRELAGLVSRASCVLSGSTGPMHIAAALGVPTVSFFPPDVVRAMSETRWGPRGNAHAVVKPRPPYGDPQAAMNAITVEEVLASLSEVLRAEGSGSVPRARST
jgi:heptosyltransferase-2